VLPEKKVPRNQGIFLRDSHGRLQLIVDTVSDFDDFIFWNYSGAPPGAGSDEGDREPPRFRSSAFIAVSGLKVAFKASTGELDSNNVYEAKIDGIYLKIANARVTTVAETGMLGTDFDPDAVCPDDEPLVVDEVALEREGLRGSFFAITIAFGGECTDEEEDVDFAGIYLTRV